VSFFLGMVAGVVATIVVGVIALCVLYDA